MILVVIASNKHYHISHLAIKHAVKNIPDIQQVVVIYDDSSLVPDNKPHMAANLSGSHTLFFSQLDFGPALDLSGWYRQQLVKLNVDRLIDADEFIIMDGDVLINETLIPNKFLYSTVISPGEVDYSMLKQALGITQWRNGDCPLMYYQANWLRSLRRIIRNEMGDINQLMVDASRSGWEGKKWILSEWEIMSHHLLENIGLTVDRKRFDYVMMDSKEMELNYNKQVNMVLRGNDGMSRDFYASNGIMIDEQIWEYMGYNLRKGQVDE